MARKINQTKDISAEKLDTCLVRNPDIGGKRKNSTDPEKKGDGRGKGRKGTERRSEKKQQ